MAVPADSQPSPGHAAIPLVGRERERAILRDHLDAAIAGGGSLVLIGGEAGIGKTTLAETVCREATDQGALILTGRCFDLTQTPPYGPWLYLFVRYHRADLLPPLPEIFPHPGIIGGLESQAALFNAALDFFRAVSTHAPLVVLLDDLHWADSASLDLLRFLAQSVATLPVLLIVTYRSDELTRRHPLYALLPVLVREARAARLDLRPLTEDDVRAVVAARYGVPDADTARLVAYLSARAEGNPFFVGELLRTLEQEGVLHETGEGWQIGDVAHVRVPTLLRQVMDGRLARLGEKARELLAVAAVIGQEVPLALWATVARGAEDELLEVIERGVEARLLVESSDGLRVRFAHALIREAVYEGILATRRRRIHRQVGERLAAAPHPDPDAVAFHFQRANDTRAVAWLVNAGERALMLFADRAAAPRLDAALALLDAREPDNGGRGWVLNYAAGAYRFIDPPRAMRYATEALCAAEEAGDRLLAQNVLRLRGWLHNDAGWMAAGLDDLLAAKALIDALTDAERAGARGRPFFVLPGPRFDGSLAEYLAICGEFARARDLGERFAADLQDEGLRPGGLSRDTAMALGNCHFGLMIAYMQQGEPEKAAGAAAKARSFYQHIDWGWMMRNVVRMECLSACAYAADRPGEWRRLAAEWDARYADDVHASEERAPRPGRVLVLAAEGRWDEARLITACIPDDTPLNHRQETSLLIAGLDRACGARVSAWKAVRAVMPDGPTAELVWQYRVQESALRLGAALALDEGNLPIAASWLEAHDALLTRSAGILGRSEGHALWARYHRQAGDSAQARADAERALGCASDPRLPLALLAAHRLLGEMDREAGRYDDAGRHLGASLALADACQMPYERALTLLARAELHAATGDTEAARTAFDEAKSTLERLGANAALARADALVARYPTLAPTRAPTYPAGLSTREVDVLRLVASGLSNAEIAARLFLSERTVEQHLRSVYNKLGSSSRTAATRFAVEHHLT